MKSGKTSGRTSRQRVSRGQRPRTGTAAMEHGVGDAATAAVLPFPPADTASPAPRTTDESCVTLDRECTAHDASALKTVLLTASGTDDAVTLDAGAVERIDTTCLQLLAAFARDRQLAHRRILWRRRSDAFDQAVQLLGLGTFLGVTGA